MSAKGNNWCADWAEKTERQKWAIFTDFYKDIGWGVPGKFDFDKLRKHYRFWMLKNHPDKVPKVKRGDAEAKCKMYNSIMTFLSDHPEYLRNDNHWQEWIEDEDLPDLSDESWVPEDGSDNRSTLPEFNGPFDPRKCSCGNDCLPFECPENLNEVDPMACYCVRDGAWLDCCMVMKCLVNPFWKGDVSSSDSEPPPQKKKKTSKKKRRRSNSTSPPRAGQGTPPKKKTKKYRRDDEQPSTSQASQDTPKKRNGNDFVLPDVVIDMTKSQTSNVYKQNKEFLIVVPADREETFSALLSDYNDRVYCGAYLCEDDGYVMYGYTCSQSTTCARITQFLKSSVSTVVPLVVAFKLKNLQAFCEFCIAQPHIRNLFHRGDYAENLRSAANQENFNPELLAEFVIDNEATSPSWVYCAYRSMRYEVQGEGTQFCQCGCGFLHATHAKHQKNAVLFSQLSKIREAVKNAIQQYEWIHIESDRLLTNDKVFVTGYESRIADYLTTMTESNEADRLYFFINFKDMFEAFDGIFVGDHFTQIDYDKALDDVNAYFNSYSRLGPDIPDLYRTIALIRARKVILFMQTVWDQIILARPRRRVLCLQGPYRSGKTTLARILTTLFKGQHANMTNEGQVAFSFGHVANARMVCFDDVTIEQFRVLDHTYRPIFDGTDFQWPVKYGNPRCTVFPPFIITTNVFPEKIPEALKSRMNIVKLTHVLDDQMSYDNFNDVVTAFACYLHLILYPYFGSGVDVNPHKWGEFLQTFDVKKLKFRTQYKRFPEDPKWAEDPKEPRIF
jgi:hypothetical protein